MGVQEQIVYIKNEHDTEEFGMKLASSLEPGDIVALIGDLGTGKTTLTKYIAKGLGVTENIDSPTFNIVKEHKSGIIPLFHLMCIDYRVVMNFSISELMNISILMEYA